MTILAILATGVGLVILWQKVCDLASRQQNNTHLTLSSLNPEYPQHQLAYGEH